MLYRVAFGIMMGFVFNLIFQTSRDDHTTVSLILGAPFVPALAASIAIWFCPESPRFYMSRGNFNPAKALEILLKLRNTEVSISPYPNEAISTHQCRGQLQALRDLYLIYKSIQQENYIQDDRNVGTTSLDPNGFLYTLLQYFSQYKQLFLQRRLRNALISSSTVSLAQQLCGSQYCILYCSTVDHNNPMPLVNVMAFYSGKGFSFDIPGHTRIPNLVRNPVCQRRYVNASSYAIQFWIWLVKTHFVTSLSFTSSAGFSSAWRPTSVTGTPYRHDLSSFLPHSI